MTKPRKAPAADSSPHSRLIAAREQNYASAADAARAMNIPLSTYQAHENGWGGITRGAERYARFFRVSLDWLLTGRGEMRGKPTPIPIRGLVGAGALIDNGKEAAALARRESISLPREGEIAAYIVEGDSQWPRFLAGEVVLYDPRPLVPDELVDQYAIVEVEPDARRLIKRLRRGRKVGRWTLESHNAPPEEEVEIRAAWRYLGTLAPRDG